MCLLMFEAKYFDVQCLILFVVVVVIVMEGRNQKKTQKK